MSIANEPAYPVGSGDMRDPCGLTKRELFAAMAMQGLLSHPKCRDVGYGDGTDGIVAIESVMMADALIAALEAK